MLIKYTTYNKTTGTLLHVGAAKNIESLDNSNQGVIEGWHTDTSYIVQNGVLVPKILTSADINKKLTKDKRLAIQYINMTTGRKRRRYITTQPGQEMVYKQKEEEAKAYMANNTIADADIPHIISEVGVTAADKASVAAVILGLADYWVAASAAIEKTRLQAINAINAATTEQEIETAKDTFNTTIAL